MYIRSARTAAATAALTISTQQGEGEDSLMGRPPSSGNKIVKPSLNYVRVAQEVILTNSLNTTVEALSGQTSLLI